MKTLLTITVALGGLLAAPAATFAAGLVPGSGADFYEAPKVQTAPKVRSDDAVTTGSTRTYSAPASSLRRGTNAQTATETDAPRVRPSRLVPGSGATFSK